MNNSLFNLNPLKPVKPEIRYFDNFDDINIDGSSRILITCKKLYNRLSLDRLNIERKIIIAFDGERCKSFTFVKHIIDRLIEYNALKTDIITVAGGGTLCDLAAFCASIYKRGCALTLIPGTLLSMIDAAHGGKTAVNAAGIKNCAGTYYSAGEIIICADLLKTLPRREIESAMFEAVKYAFLFSSNFIDYIIKNSEKFHEYNKNNHIFLKRLIKKCIDYKYKIIRNDSFDNHIRLSLNYGHTFGHAFESAAEGGLLHGEAVGLGMISELAFTGFKYGITADIIKMTAILLKIMRNCASYKKIDEIIKSKKIYDKLYQYIINDKKNISHSGGNFIKMPILEAPELYKIEKISIEKEIEPFLKCYNLHNHLIKIWKI